MSESWPTIRLGQLVEGGELSYGIVQPGREEPSGVPIVRVKDLDQGRISTRAPLRVAPSISERHSRTVLRGGELLVSIVGTIGESAIVPRNLAGWNTARAIAVIRPSGVSAAWIRLVLLTREARAALGGVLNTTVQSTLNLADLKRLPIPMPPEEVRRAITDMLGALDNKITANSEVLCMADGLIRAKFDSLEGEDIPLNQIATNVRDQVHPQSISATDPYVGLEHIPRRRMWLDNHGNAGKMMSVKTSFRAGDVLFGKLRPYFHKVASAAFDGIASTDVLVIRAKRKELAGYVLAAASADHVVRAATAASEGTRMPRTSWADIGATQIRWCGDAAAEAFSSDVTALACLTAQLARESASLGRMRDELLPLLMSGKIHVRDAERQVEDAL